MEVKIRKWREEDAPFLAAAANSEGVAINLRDGFPQPYKESDGWDFISFCHKNEGIANIERAVIVDGTPVGTIGLRIDAGNARSGEIGYFLHSHYWGKGVMTEAVRLFCQEVFETTDVCEVHALVLARNARSRRVLEKCGFQFVGSGSIIRHGEQTDTLKFIKNSELNSSDSRI